MTAAAIRKRAQALLESLSEVDHLGRPPGGFEGTAELRAAERDEEAGRLTLRSAARHAQHVLELLDRDAGDVPVAGDAGNTGVLDQARMFLEQAEGLERAARRAGGLPRSLAVTPSPGGRPKGDRDRIVAAVDAARTKRGTLKDACHRAWKDDPTLAASAGALLRAYQRAP